MLSAAVDPWGGLRLPRARPGADMARHFISPVSVATRVGTHCHGCLVERLDPVVERSSSDSWVWGLLERPNLFSFFGGGGAGDE